MAMLRALLVGLQSRELVPMLMLSCCFNFSPKRANLDGIVGLGCWDVFVKYIWMWV